MTINDIRRIAQGVGIRLQGRTKAEMVRSIQTEEGNIPCYATRRVHECREFSCLWREDCQAEEVIMSRRLRQRIKP